MLKYIQMCNASLDENNRNLIQSVCAFQINEDKYHLI